MRRSLSRGRWQGAILLKEPASAPDFRQRMDGSRGHQGNPREFEHLESGEKLQVGMSGDIEEVLVAGHELETVVDGDRCNECVGGRNSDAVSA